jgi:hypothetical protein
VKGRRGLGRARRLIAKRIREGARPESRLTRKLLNLIVAAALPIPVSLHEIRLPDGRILHPDLAYPDLMIAIEADSYKHHGDDRGWRSDIHRDNGLQPAGWIVLRFTWDDVVNKPDYVIQTITDALRARPLGLADRFVRFGLRDLLGLGLGTCLRWRFLRKAQSNDQGCCGR